VKVLGPSEFLGNLSKQIKAMEIQGISKLLSVKSDTGLVEAGAVVLVETKVADVVKAILMVAIK
jgi:hypothetical protein